MSDLAPANSLAVGAEMEGGKENCEFLAGLPADTNEYRYPGSQEQLEEIMLQEYKQFDKIIKSQFVVFTNISPSQFRQLYKAPGVSDYIPNTLIIKMPCVPHEILGQEFSGLLQSKAREMGVWRLFMATGSATRGNSNERSKEPDISFQPRFTSAPRQWPTIVVETAYSESREKVIRDVAFWLNKTQGQVNMAMSIDIKRPSGNITISGWRAGAQATRNHPDPAPVEIYKMKISRGEKGQGPSVTGDNLTIPFYDLILRQPHRNTPERDFVFTKEEMLEVAEMAWEQMRKAGHLKS